MRWIPLVVLGLMGLINLGRGAIHAFSVDGGAASIAGLDLSTSRETILSLFATLGLAQMAKGVFELYVVARRRDLLALFLAMQTFDTLLAVANLYLWRPLPVSVPGQPFNLVLLVLQVLALLIAIRRAPSGPAGPAAT
ncbi:hypothetical protein ACN2C7_08250 [Caulobacter sp. ErkDOM-E]|uniref:hypothetical protein n=1 Tax=Caulobacter sp. ErkDOM-E TaxID=3402778 RepID=UPI003AF76494